MFFAHSITVTISHRVVSRDGDYTVTGSYQLPGCAFSLVSKTRSFETLTYEQDTVRGLGVLFAPTGSDVRGTDTVTLEDKSVWHVWGNFTDLSSPFSGWRPGMQVPLRHFSG